MFDIVQSKSADESASGSIVEPRANFDVAFPELPDYDGEIATLNRDLLSMVDLERVVVVTGYAELSPWGNSRTRWEIEANGKFSMEGCIEIAWIMGLVKHYNGVINGSQYIGWVDSVTGAPVQEKDIFSYETRIFEHTGIRLMEPELLEGYDPLRRTFIQEIVVSEDMASFEASHATAVLQTPAWRQSCHH